jgi:hypothetical protein
MIAPIWSAIPPAMPSGGMPGSPAAFMMPERASPR